jgi:hypothetical protein
MNSSPYLRFLILCGAVLSIGAIGCSEYVPVTGTVLVDGEPAQGLEIDFSPAEAGQEGGGMAYTDEQGDYVVHASRTQEGIVPGSYVVRIVTENEEYDPEEYDLEEGEAPPPPPQRIRIPARYNSQTDLNIEVSHSNKVFDFDLVTTEE